MVPTALDRGEEKVRPLDGRDLAYWGLRAQIYLTDRTTEHFERLSATLKPGKAYRRYP